MTEIKDENLNILKGNCRNRRGASYRDTDCTSLLFFFLLLVCIFNKYDCGCSQDSLLLFFLLLVVLMNDNDC